MPYLLLMATLVRSFVALSVLVVSRVKCVLPVLAINCTQSE